MKNSRHYRRIFVTNITTNINKLNISGIVRCLSIAIVIALIAGGTAFAQVETGQIAGTVIDPSGAVVVGATVSATNISTNAERKSVTSSVGTYVITGLAPTTYTVKITSGSFQPYAAKVQVTVGGHLTLDAKLSVNSGTTEVQVVAEGGNQVNTQSQELSQLVNSQQLASLPSLTRNPYDFVALSGNVSAGDNTTNSFNSGQNLTTRGVGVSINGQRESGTEILLDGIENLSIFSDGVGENLPVDAVQEYSVITNNFSAEYGRASGGVVNLTTKSGTNAYHGSAWEYNRLSAYTANTYANDAANAAAGSIVAPKGKYTRNQFGFFAGGPILKNKLFASGGIEWTRVRSAANETQEVLDPGFIAMLPANTQNYFKTFGQGAHAASGQTVTADMLASSGLTLGNINGTTPIPGSTPVFDVVNFTAPFDAGGGYPENNYTLMARLDLNLNDRTQMFFRAGHESVNEFPGSTFYSAYPQYNVGTVEGNQTYLYSLSHSFSPTLFSNSKLSFARYNEVNSFDQAQIGAPMLMIVPPVDPATSGLIQLPGLENAGAPGAGGLPYGGPQNTIQAIEDLSWTKGKHSMKFGGGITYIQLNVAYGAYAQAVEQLGGTLQSSFDDLLNVAGNPGGSQLVAFEARVNPQGKLPCVANPAYWATGSVSDLQQTPNCAVTPPLNSANYARSYRYDDWAVYAQDSYKITSRLNFNYGLRYEHYGVQHNNRPLLDSNFYFGSGSTTEQQVRSGNVYIAKQSPVGGFWAPSWGTLAPRIGFAYDLTGNGRTSVRGGYGISYERNFGNVTFNASFNPPASAVLRSACPSADPNCSALVTNNNLGPLGLAGPSSYLPPSSLRMPDPNIHVAQTQFWSLAVQHQLGRSTLLELGYSGAHGLHLYDVENINQLGAGQVYLNDPLTFLDRPNNQYSDINMRGSLGASSYNSLNIKLQTQNLHNTGLSLVTNYTYSHSLDDLSSTFSDSLQGGSEYIGSLGYTNPFNPMLDWGSSDYDIRHRLVVSPIWETPWFKTGTGTPIERQILGGWTFSGIVTARTGTPFSVYDYTNINNFYTIPRLTPSTQITQYKVGKPVNTGTNTFTALSVPTPISYDPLNSTLGISDFGPFPINMTGRNAFRGPGAWNADIALNKSFKITERVGLVFRAEGFDVFNHHNYYVNTTNLYYDGPSSPLDVTELKGGLGSLATGGNHDERRFGQFALKATF